MKKCFIIFFIFLSIFCNNSIHSVSKKTLKYRKDISNIINIIKESSNDPKPLAYPELINYYETLFQYDCFKLEFKTYILDKNKKVILDNEEVYEVWFDTGDLYIKSTNDNNYITSENKIYEWKNGEITGNILKREKYDTISYLEYLVDGSHIKKSIYFHYLEDPKKFIKNEKNGLFEILYKEPEYGFLGITFITNPLWFFDFIILDKNNEETNNQNIYIEVSLPIKIDSIPKEISTIPKDIKWEKVKYTLFSKMV